MSKALFHRVVAHRTSISLKEVEGVCDAIEKIVQEAVKAGGEIVVPGLGRFSTRELSARRGRNPKTGESILIPPSRRVRFQAASSLKQNVKV